jgi:hypothetical protein
LSRAVVVIEGRGKAGERADRERQLHPDVQDTDRGGRIAQDDRGVGREPGLARAEVAAATDQAARAGGDDLAGPEHREVVGEEDPRRGGKEPEGQHKVDPAGQRVGADGRQQFFPNAVVLCRYHGSLL